MRRVLPFIASVVLSCAACGGSSESGAASCATTVTIDGSISRSCSEWTGLSSDELITVRTLCNLTIDASSGSADAGVAYTSMNEFRAGPCERTGAIGGCLLNGGAGLGETMTSWSYEGSYYTRESVQQGCEAAGWTFVEP